MCVFDGIVCSLDFKKEINVFVCLFIFYCFIFCFILRMKFLFKGFIYNLSKI